MTASGSSAGTMATGCACSPGAAMTGPIRVPTMAEALMALRVKSITIDGEGGGVRGSMV